MTIVQGYSRLALVLISVFFLASTTVTVQAQDQSGFISIDCGSTTAYTDKITGINYVPDSNFIDSGENKNIAASYNDVIPDTHLRTVRSFPDGARNCYTIRHKVNTVNGTRFLIRARFVYGDYDLKNLVPEFDLYIGVNLWATIQMEDVSSVTTEEMIYLTGLSVTSVCLVNKGSGTPFISALEMRILENSAYILAVTGSINLVRRANMVSGSKNRYRFPDDEYDRIWEPTEWGNGVSYLSTTETPFINNGYNPPKVVMSSAVVASTAFGIVNRNLDRRAGSDQYYSYFHFSEVQKLAANETREFNIYLDSNEFFYGPFSPEYLGMNTLWSVNPHYTKSYNFSITGTPNSSLPPTLNAYEIYSYNPWNQSATNAADIEAMDDIRSSYGEGKIWQGDPCAPQNYSWEGLSCVFKEFDAPIIIGLNLSSSNLKGSISTDISNLKSLQSLDLSNNDLSGVVPEFLSSMTSLRFLNLNNNNFSGTIPPTLVRKSSEGSLILSFEGNPVLCSSNICNKPVPPRKSSVQVAVIVAIVVSILFLLALLVVLFVFRSKIFKGGKETVIVAKFEFRGSSRDILRPQRQRFSYADVLKMTGNLQKVIGIGGFGTVYYGRLEDTQVAVKMLSPLSSQGYKEFKAEAQLLTRVHHKNLTSLIGYCNDGGHLGLIYEFMENGNLEPMISGTSAHFLTWKERLQTSLDAAQGLDYLHNGCKPSIVHRDVKPTNILLGENFTAKLADFGLSRDSLANGREYESTVVAGTLGYLDPEYCQTQRINEKSDVYSFGVVLLRMITGKPTSVSTEDTQTHISGWVNQVISISGDVKSIVDHRLQGEYEINSAWLAIELAMSCVSPTSATRPNMSQVVSDLKQCLEMGIARKGEPRNSEFSSVVMPFDTSIEQPSAR